MSRKRYISTDLSTDAKLAELTAYGYLPLVLYTWSIPHMDDWGRITGDARQFRLLVCPGFDATVKEIEEALNLIAKVGLWERYEADGKLCIAISPESWFRHQSYINKAKREDDSGSNHPSPAKRRRTPNNTEERQDTPAIAEEQRENTQIAASFSSSVSCSFSSSKDSTTTPTTPGAPFRLFETEGFGTISGTIAEKLGEMIDFYGERWVIEAMKEASLSGKRSLKYVESILKRYKAEGIDEPWRVERKGSEQDGKYGRRSEGYKSGTNQSTRTGKPQLTVVDSQSEPLTPEEIEEIQRIARKLDGAS